MNTPGPRIEWVEYEGNLLACIIRPQVLPASTMFVTPPNLTQQVGFIVYPAGEAVQRHIHVAIERTIQTTAEVLVVSRGLCELDVFGEDLSLVATRQLRVGDVVLLIGGGHGLRILEDTVLLEVKQGPYTGLDEKRRF